jgi:histidinol dehydrogenase
MSEFDSIVVLASQADFAERISRLRNELSLSGFLKVNPSAADSIRQIVVDIAARGDAALLDYTEKFDKVKFTASQIRVPKDELKKAHSQIDNALLASLRKATANVRSYQSEIFIGNQGVTRPKQSVAVGCGIRYMPIRRVGVCVPGASAPLPSTVIMTVVPAQVAGVKEIAVISPPRCQGSIHPVILAVCCELGIEEVYRVGGAQAVAAIAYGTQTIPKVDKIVGPGNHWVQLAKKEVFGAVDIDSIAGPSEVLIVATDAANPAWLAADMLSQAEHDPGSALLITDSQKLAHATLSQLKTQVKQLPRAEQTAKCLNHYSCIIVTKDIDEAIELANDFASEHLQIQCGDQSRAVAEKIVNAGAIFIGDYTPVAVGDYYAGPSHTLPTGQSAKFFSALSVNDFIKATSVIEYDKQKLAAAAADIIRLAQTEGLDAHAKSVSVRL